MYSISYTIPSVLNLGRATVPPLFEVRNLNAEFARTLSLLRQEKGVSQRAAAAQLGISQALLSHYEKESESPACPLWSGPATTTTCRRTIFWAAP